MSGEPEKTGAEERTGELQKSQLRREAEEHELARTAEDDEQTAQHERRADKARYLRDKLEQRARSERED
jgi:hypothetical protein